MDIHKSGVAGIVNGSCAVEVIQPQNLHVFWEQAKPFLQMAIDESHGDAQINGIRAALIKGSAQLMCVFDPQTSEMVAALTVEVFELESGKRALTIQYVGGSRMDEWLPEAMSQLKELKRLLLCDEIRGIGRFGWYKVLQKYGWKPVSTIIVYED